MIQVFDPKVISNESMKFDDPKVIVLRSSMIHRKIQLEVWTFIKSTVILLSSMVMFCGAVKPVYMTLAPRES